MTTATAAVWRRKVWAMERREERVGCCVGRESARFAEEERELSNSFSITSRPEESVANSNPSFTDGVATKDIHIDPFTLV
ncbi:hypothetical protein MTR_2g019360 [Medicago truncatula]|uniref:Uncharacterized protein n=1 Tax=Medicago truncatula TaxID=3880 RepID=G7IPV4_MEDTR|nr:hypothetical protein MTR_2g019360 [Medicago truncatula]